MDWKAYRQLGLGEGECPCGIRAEKCDYHRPTKTYGLFYAGQWLFDHNNISQYWLTDSYDKAEQQAIVAAKAYKADVVVCEYPSGVERCVVSIFP